MLAVEIGVIAGLMAFSWLLGVLFYKTTENGEKFAQRPKGWPLSNMVAFFFELASLILVVLGLLQLEALEKLLPGTKTALEHNKYIYIAAQVFVLLFVLCYWRFTKVASGSTGGIKLLIGLCILTYVILYGVATILALSSEGGETHMQAYIGVIFLVAFLQKLGDVYWFFLFWRHGLEM